MNRSPQYIILIILGILISIWTSIEIATGNIKTAYFAILLVLGIPAVLTLGLKNWYGIPFSVIASLPAIPLVGGRTMELSEIWICISVAIIGLHILLGRIPWKNSLTIWWPMLLFVGWTALIAVIDGGGIAIFGAEQVGGRRYLSVYLSLFAMLVLSQVKLGEKEARNVLIAMVLGYVISGLFRCFSAYMGYSSSADGPMNEFYSWQQGLSAISLGGTMYLFGRYKVTDMFNRPRLALTYILLLALAAYSGKRMGFAGCCIMPMIACVWHRQVAFSLLAMGIGIIGLIGAVATQNSGVSLPKSLQRVLYFLPAKWDWDVERSAVYTFRETLNRLAIEKIKDNPVIGEGVGMKFEEQQMMEDPSYVASIMDPDDDPQAYPHAVGKNWHSTWIGLAATLGIPGAIFWIFIQIKSINQSWKFRRYFPYGSWRLSLAGFLFLTMWFQVITSYTSGDIANLAMKGGMVFGLLAALWQSTRETLAEVHVKESEVE